MNVPETLAREIGRVTELRGQYTEISGMPQVNVRPVLAMIDAALERAKAAAGEGADPIVQIRAVEELRSFTG